MKTKSEDQKRLKELISTLIPQARSRVSILQREISSMEREANDLTARLAPKPSDVPKVSDHALIRYMERAHGFDFTVFREEILTPERRAMIEAGAREIKAGNFKFRLDGKTIVTVI